MSFANFTAVEKNGIVSTEQGFLVRMTDKMQRINSYVQQGKLLVEDEKVTDTLMDLANYCVLMSGYLTSKETKSPTLWHPLQEFAKLEEDILQKGQDSAKQDELRKEMNT